jgi:drug/metabolite transporter (DMT)-like permease
MNQIADKKLSSLYGALCCFIVVVLWGIEPLFMKVALIEFDSYSITWFRVTGAFLLLVPIMKKQGGDVVMSLRLHAGWVVISGVCLGVYFLAFIKGIELGGPVTAAVTIQIGPPVLAIAGVMIFKEYLSRAQVVGVCVAFLGYLLFFHARLSVAEAAKFHVDAVLYVVVAALAWVGFCIGQKVTGRHVSTKCFNLMTFFVASLFLLVTTSIPGRETLLTWSFSALVYLSFSTFFAYWALGEAIRLLPISIVSFFVTVNPFITILVVEALRCFGNEFYEPQPLTLYGYIGTAMALLGVGGATIRRSSDS